MRLGRILDRRLRPAEQQPAATAAEPPAVPQPDRPERPSYLDLLMHSPQPHRIMTRYLLSADTSFPSYVHWQSLYTDLDARRLIPNTTIFRAGELALEVNALGCKGPDIDASLPLIACFGDSTTMGIDTDGWPYHVDVDGYAVLNAAWERPEMSELADRFEELRPRVDIRCAVIYAGWHNLIYNRTDERYWETQLRRFLGDHVSAFCTIGTCVTPEVVERGIEPLLDCGPEALVNGEYFNFWMDLDASATLEPLFAAIERYDAFIREFCECTRSVLIDLRRLLAPVSYDDVPRDFFDVCHLRPRAYARVGRYVTEQIRTGLPAAPMLRARAAPTRAAEATEDLRDTIYPVW